MSMTFQSNKMPFLALELPRFLTFDMDQLGKHRGHHWKKRLKISKTGNLIWKWYVFSKWRYSSASCEILQMFVWWRGEGLCPPPLPPTPPYQCLENLAALRSHIFVTFGNKWLSNLEIVLIWRRSFQPSWQIVSNFLSMSKVKKHRWRVSFTSILSDQPFIVPLI